MSVPDQLQLNTVSCLPRLHMQEMKSTTMGSNPSPAVTLPGAGMAGNALLNAASPFQQQPPV